MALRDDGQLWSAEHLVGTVKDHLAHDDQWRSSSVSAHMRSGAEADVASALRRLLDSMGRVIDAKLIAPPDEFRAEHCYTQEVDAVLRQNEKSVRAIFGGSPPSPRAPMAR